jgi:hypothetical protein
MALAGPHAVDNASTSSISRRAIASLLLALFLGPVGALPAIFLGHRALRDIRQGSNVRGSGLAAGGLVIGYTVAALTILYFAVVAFVKITGGA